MAVTPNLRKGTFACESVPRNKTTKILLMATGLLLRQGYGVQGKGLGRDFGARKALALVETMKLPLVVTEYCRWRPGKGLGRDSGVRKALALVETYNLGKRALKTEQTE
jgi:hypothetical protein